VTEMVGAILRFQKSMLGSSRNLAMFWAVMWNG
jgi:hypothetical protein